MNFATSTGTRQADRHLVPHPHDDPHDHPCGHGHDHLLVRPRSRRLRGSCCAAAMAVALSVPSTATSSAPVGPSPVSSRALSSRVLSSGPAWPATAATGEVASTAQSRGAAARTPVRALASTSKVVHARRVCVRVANVRSGPGLSHRVVTTLTRGRTVRGTTTRGWLRIRAGRWIALSVTCASGSGSSAAQSQVSGGGAFQTWVRAIDPAGNATWRMDRARSHTRGNVRGLTVFRGSGPARSTVYIQPGMTWSKTKLVMAHEAIHVRQIRYGGFAHSLAVFGSVNGMERAADCGATLILGRVVRAGCSAGQTKHVRNLLAGRPA